MRMNESCVGLREKRKGDASKAADNVSAFRRDEDTLSTVSAAFSSAAELQQIENAAITLCEQVLQELGEDSVFFEQSPSRPIAMFHEEEVRLGSLLGQGEFGTVREVREVSLTQRQLLRKDSSKLNLYDESYTQDDGSGLSKMDRDRLTIRELSFRDGQARYAVKRVREDLEGTQRVMAALDLAVEARFLASLTHPNIIRMRGAGGQPGTPSFMLIMDRLCLTLEEKIEAWKAEEREAAGGCIGFRSKAPRVWSHDVLEKIVVAYDIARALNFLHEHNLIYRDLKPANLGFDIRGHVKLFDMGLAKELKISALVEGDDKYDLTPMTGTRRWMAPEVCLSKPYGLAADVYSFGLMIWHLIILEVPFGENIAPKQHFKRVIKGGKRPRVPLFIPTSVRQLMRSCWHADADLRPKLGSVCIDLRDEIASFKQRMNSKSLLDRTEHLRLHSKRSLKRVWLALGLPTSSNRLDTRMGEPSSGLEPITETEPTETVECRILPRLLQVPNRNEDWQDRLLFGSAIECQMPVSWNDLSFQLSYKPENREIWQDGEGEARDNSSYLLNVEVREQQDDLRAAVDFYYQEAANANHVDNDRRKWQVVSYQWHQAPVDTETTFGRGHLTLDQGNAVSMELVVLRRSNGSSSMELVIVLFTGISSLIEQDQDDDYLLSPTFRRFLESLRVRDLNELLGE